MLQVGGNFGGVFDKFECQVKIPFPQIGQEEPDDNQHSQEHDEAFGFLGNGNVAFFFGFGYFSFGRFFRFGGFVVVFCYHATPTLQAVEALIQSIGQTRES